MRLDSRIKRLPPQYFRHSLRVEDLVDIGSGCKLIEVVSSVDGSTEIAATFTDNPIVYPHMPYGRDEKVESWEDIRMLITSLLFINPTIGDEGLIKMAGYIYKYFVYFNEDGEPMFSIDDINTSCTSIRGEYGDDDDYPIAESNRVILFQNFSNLSSKDKSRYSLIYHHEWWGLEIGEFIHKAVIHTVKTTPYPKLITKGMVKDNTVIIRNGEKKALSDIRTYNKNILEKSLVLLELDGKKRYISSKQYDKWKEFLKLPDDLSLDKICSEIKISKSTAIKFRNFKNNKGYDN